MSITPHEYTLGGSYADLRDTVPAVLRKLRTLAEWHVGSRWRDHRADLTSYLTERFTGSDATEFYFAFDKPGVVIGSDITITRTYPDHPYRVTVSLNDGIATLVVGKLLHEELTA